MPLIWDTYGVLEDGPLGIWCPRGHIPAVAPVLALSNKLSTLIHAHTHDDTEVTLKRNPKTDGLRNGIHIRIPGPSAVGTMCCTCSDFITNCLLGPSCPPGH